MTPASEHLTKAPPTTKLAGSGYRPLRIGPLTLGLPAVQAALTNYSDSAMRRTARAQGAPYALAEMIVNAQLDVPGRRRDRHLTIADGDRPLGGQLIGSDPEGFAAGATHLVEAGFDVVDINFGCPLKRVLGRCRGGYLLGEPATALAVIEATVAAVRRHAGDRVPVTVKMRRGLDDSPRSRDMMLAILEGAIARGVAAVTVHGRTVAQRYIGPADWSFLREVVALVHGRCTVLGSGDLFTADDVAAMIATTGVDGVTVARGAIGNPWVFAEVAAALTGQPPPPPPTVAQQRAVIAQHHQWSVALYGPQRAAAMMRKFAIHYARRHPNAPAVRTAMINTQTPDDWLATLEAWYPADDHRPGRPTPAASRDSAPAAEAASQTGTTPAASSEVGFETLHCA